MNKKRTYRQLTEHDEGDGHADQGPEATKRLKLEVDDARLFLAKLNELQEPKQQSL